jgi:hypothetical protein
VLVFRESGRLGNQLFQYAALRTLCQQSEKLILLGFYELQSMFDGIDASIINAYSPKIERLFYHRLYRLASSLSQNNIIARISESSESINPKIIYTPGLFNKIAFIETSYFQSETLFDMTSISSMRFKHEILDSTKATLNAIAQKNIPIFVHVRRGDYISWPKIDNPAVLPATYYQKCIDVIKSKISNAFFIFLSDDPFYVKDVFGNLENSYISQGSSLEDFALISQCYGGILSASSFSWWAAYFSHLQNPKSIFLAPKYWVGHRTGYWHPPFIESSFLKYVDV